VSNYQIRVEEVQAGLAKLRKENDKSAFTIPPFMINFPFIRRLAD
jgi:hypothetical protein